MTTVQTLRLRGLCASSLLALAACSGTPSDFVSVNTGNDAANGVSMTTAPAAESPATPAQDPQGPQGRQAVIEKALARARQSLDLRLFEDARNEAAYALELDNGNVEARDIVQRCNRILNDNPGETGRGLVSDLILRDVIKRERERTKVEQEMQRGDVLLQQGKFGLAVDSFERAATVMKFSVYAEINDPLRKEAEARLADARAKKAAAEQQALDSARSASEDELRRMARNQQIAQEQKVDSLLENANLRFQAGDYPETLHLVERALLQDPTNQTALALRDLADRARHNNSVELSRESFRTEWNKTFAELAQSNVPQTETVVFDPTRWAAVSQRQPQALSESEALESPENQAILKILNDTVLEHNFASATVQTWAAYYGQVTGVTFFVTPEVAEMPADTTTLQEFRLNRRSVASALKAIQAQTGVAYKVRDGMVQLVSPANAIGNLVYKPYKVADITTGHKNHPGPNLRLNPPGDDEPQFVVDEEEPQPTVVEEGRLVDMLKATVASDKFEAGTFTMSPQNGVLYVLADQDTHQQLDRLLSELRRHVGIQIDVESRFLKVEDSFLEDVGVDLRGLGNQASQGVAGRGLEKQGPRPNVGFDDQGPRQQQNPATPGLIGTGTSPGVFYDDGNDGDIMARTEGLYNQTLGGRSGGLTNAGGLSLQYAFLDDTELEVVLRAVAKQERSEELQAPRLLIFNNQRSSMHFLRNISYIKDFDVEIAQAAAVANPVIGTVNDGVALDVRPVVDSELRFITMEMRPTVVTLQFPIPTFTTTLGVGQPISIQLPELQRQTVRTTVTIPDGGTMMLGGMRLVERQNLRSTVPLLGSLPGLGWLFSRNGTSVQNRKILILVKASIVLMDEHEPDPVMLPEVSPISAR